MAEVATYIRHDHAIDLGLSYLPLSPLLPNQLPSCRMSKKCDALKEM